MKEKQYSNSIDVKGLEKSFGEVRAVTGVDFEVREGEIFGFLGPNGAGKTTTINMLTGLARPDSGSISIAGSDFSHRPKTARQSMGIVADESNLYPELSGFDNLCFCGALYGMPKQKRRERAEELLELFNLGDASRRKFGTYSKGMKRKLTIAAGIIHSPSILFLDEPTSGIDVASARQIRKLISNLNDTGATIFLTTHYIEEAERLCGRIAFIVSGRIVRTDTVQNLMRDTEGKHTVRFEISGNAGSLGEEIAASFPELTWKAGGGNSISVESAVPVKIGPIVRFLEDKGAEVYEARKVKPSLEEVFVHITGIEASAMKAETGKKGGKA